MSREEIARGASRPRPSRRLAARRLWQTLLAAGLLAAAALPATASAGVTFLFDKGRGEGRAFGGLSFFESANAAERNDVRIFGTSGPGGALFVFDGGGAANFPAGPCTRPGSSTAHVLCPGTWPSGFDGAGEPINQFFVVLGGEGDVLRLDDPLGAGMFFGEVDGGSGRDRIRIGSPTSGDVGGKYILVGRSGNDALTIVRHGVGNSLIGGAGDDRISTFANGRGDFVICDSGRRDRAVVDLRDTTDVSCERVFRAPKDQHPIVKVRGRRLKVKGGRAKVKLSCPKDATSHCKGRLRILRGKQGNKSLGKANYNVRKGKRGTVRVKVSRRRGLVRVVTREPGSDVGPKQGITQLRLKG